MLWIVLILLGFIGYYEAVAYIQMFIKNYKYLDEVSLRGTKGFIKPFNGPYFKYIEDFQQLIEFEKDITDSEVNEIIKNLKIVIGNELVVTKHINQRDTYFSTQLKLDYRGFNNE